MNHSHINLTKLKGQYTKIIDLTIKTKLAPDYICLPAILNFYENTIIASPSPGLDLVIGYFCLALFNREVMHNDSQ